MNIRQIKKFAFFKLTIQINSWNARDLTPKVNTFFGVKYKSRKYKTIHIAYHVYFEYTIQIPTLNYHHT